MPSTTSAGAGQVSPPLELPEESRWVWEHVTGEMARMGTLTDADLLPIVTLCIEWAEYIRARTMVDAAGAPLRDADGKAGPKNDPSVARGNASVAVIVRLIAELGLSPTARERLTVKFAPKDPEREKRRAAVQPRRRGGLMVHDGGK